MSQSILIVDDEADIRNLISEILEDEGYETRSAQSSDQFYEAVNEALPELVILDIWLQGSDEDGIDILKKFKKHHPDIPVVMISGHGTIETAVESIKYGAYDFIEKPFKSDRLLLLLTRALETRALLKENKTLKKKIEGDTKLIGDSPAMAEVRQTLERVAPTNSRVLLTGEQGTGKDVAAKFLHQASKRSEGPFMVLNCAILRPDRLEAELFGVEHSPETGGQAKGVLEKANGGTVFLDEISDMPLETQGKIIRVIQDQSFHRVGGTEEISVDVRFVASSNQDLIQAMQEGDFRQDLYYRLSVVPIHIPPLRERPADIPKLCQYFIDQYAISTATLPRVLSDAALAIIQGYHWPGNVRQLRNAIEWVMIMSENVPDKPVAPEQLPPEIVEGRAEGKTKEKLVSKTIAGMSLKEARLQFERDYLKMQIARFQGNISKTASFIGMERSALHRKLKSLDLRSGSSHNDFDEDYQKASNKSLQETA